MGRKDGTKVKSSADPMYLVAAHFMDKRIDSMNMITIDIPVDPMNEYLNRKRKEGKHYDHMSLYITAMIHAIAEYPAINRFVVNKTVYSRNEIAIGMIVLKGGKIDQHGAMDKMKFQPDFTIDEVDETIRNYVEKNRDMEEVNSTDKVVNVLLSVPGLVRFGVNTFKFMDRHGLLSKNLIDLSPFHATAVFTNLASIRTNHIYHHIYEFGTTSISIALGNARYVPKMKKGEIQHVKCMPMGIVMDERICSGAYFALAFRYFAKLLENPECLEKRPAVKPDI